MSIKIDKGIPIPDRVGLYSGEVTKALKSLEVGDSILLPLNKRIGVYSVARYHKIKVLTRKVGKDQFRIWRAK